ncbi:hypothetical protein JQK62_24630 [Leptospira santarosai]|nr:hypothetical protein [Leptospira santarosai]
MKSKLTILVPDPIGIRNAAKNKSNTSQKKGIEVKKKIKINKWNANQPVLDIWAVLYTQWVSLCIGSI